ncbi:putative ribonuclease H-like domain-containing protein [Rosa chinensis]|uniref:Putative ribonuclease H-like domain-containing protein n=1 Tax=Rosa chinensis TaxID=74649 RepID=A0A2P6PLQ0_ROSCH|nr:putative ribonuclease H-like domain-containing protein [Rosa chinensis]
MVEALAGRLACQIALEFHLSPVTIETDCLQLVQAIQTEGEDTSVFGRVIDDISLALTSLAGSFFCHVYRESNKIAHKLAHSAMISGLQVSWSGDVPPVFDEILCNN